jgi:hypothetical protein
MTGFEEVKRAVEIDQAIQSVIGELAINHPEIAQVFYDLARVKQISPINSIEGALNYHNQNATFLHGLIDSVVEDNVVYPLLQYNPALVPGFRGRSWDFGIHNLWVVEDDEAIRVRVKPANLGFTKKGIKPKKRGKKIKFKKPRIWDRIGYDWF